MNRILISITLLVVTLCGCQKRASNEIVASIDNTEISMADLDGVIEKQLHLMLQGIHILRRETLKEYINEIIIKKEAAKNNTTVSELKASIIKQKLTKEFITSRSAELNGFIPDSRDPQKGYDITTEFGYNYLLHLLKKEVINIYTDSVKTNYAITTNLPSPEKLRPSVDISDLKVNYFDHNKKGVSLILVGNYGCESCKSSLELVNRIYAKHKKRVSYGYVFFDAIPSLPALAADAAAAQNKFREMHHALYNSRVNIYDSTHIKRLAETLNLNIQEFNESIASEQLKKTIEKNIETLNTQGVYATPSLIINGKIFMPPFKEVELNDYVERLLE